MKKITVFILAVILLLCGCDDMSGDNLLKIDGENIKTSEYMIFLYEQKKSFEETGGEDIWEMDFDGIKAQEVAKQNAVNSLIMVKNAVKQADKLNVFLSDEDEKKAEEEAKLLYEEMGDYAKNNGITAEEVEKTIRESILQDKVYEFITKGYEISQAEFDSYFENYCEENKKELKDITIKYIYKKCDVTDTKNRAEIEEIYEQVLTSENFDDMLIKNSDGDKKSISIEDGDLPEEIKDSAYNMNEGDISGILESADGFYIIKVIGIKETDIEKLREDVEKTYIEEKKREIYAKQNEVWSKDVKVEKNDEQWNKIDIDTVGDKFG